MAKRAAKAAEPEERAFLVRYEYGQKPFTCSMTVWRPDIEAARARALAHVERLGGGKITSIEERSGAA